MRREYRGLQKTIVCMFLLVGALFGIVSATQEANFTIPTISNQVFEYVSYDRDNTTVSNYSSNITYGTNTYIDYSPTNLNAVLNICHPELAVGQKVDLVYASQNYTLLRGLIRFQPRITSVFSAFGGASNCTRIDTDLSSARAFYPGHVFPLVSDANVSVDYDNPNTTLPNATIGGNSSDPGAYLLPNVDQFFNGSYEISVNVIGPPKEYQFIVSGVFDGNRTEINTTQPYLVTSFANSSGESLVEGVISPGEFIQYDGDLLGGETVYVNDIRSLELKVYSPCDPFNESGYFIMNSSAFNQNDTCVIINQTNNAVLNFAGELIDGDNLTNGSMANNRCGVLIKDSQNITLENFYTQQYYHGLCIDNSSVRIFGTGAFENINGIYAYNNTVLVVDELIVDNNDTEMIAIGNTSMNLLEANLTTAFVDIEFFDATLTAVPNPPEPPNITNVTDIEQYIEVTNNSENSYVQVSFHYPIPLPNNVTPANISIFKYNGSYGNIVSGNSSSPGWENGTWETVFTLIAPASQLIIGENVTNFSVFAPFGFETETQDDPTPDPVPDPDPDPDPESGPTSGSGGSPSSTEQSPDEVLTDEGSVVELELELPDNVTVQQGEAVSVDYNITNKDPGSVGGLTIGPLPPSGWDATNSSVPGLGPEETLPGNFQLAPYETAIPGKYSVPVSVWITEDDNRRVITQILDVYVQPRGDLKRIRILEYPPEITVAPFSQRNISFFARNIGDFDFGNLTVKLDSSNCIVDIQGQEVIDRDQSKVLTYTFFFGEEDDCDYNVKFYDGDDIVGFVPLSVAVEPLAFTLAEIAQLSIIVIVLVLWTLLTMKVMRSRSRRIYKEEAAEEEEEEGFYY